MTEKRSPWFNARTQPPVNGGDRDFYEHSCTEFGRSITQEFASTIKRWGEQCPHCQWRGLMREPPRTYISHEPPRADCVISTTITLKGNGDGK